MYLFLVENKQKWWRSCESTIINTFILIKVRSKILRIYIEMQNNIIVLTYLFCKHLKNMFYDLLTKSSCWADCFYCFCSYKWWFASFTVIILISFVVQRQFIDKNEQIQNERLFTAEELQSYTKDELYLAILGKKYIPISSK